MYPRAKRGDAANNSCKKSPRLDGFLSVQTHKGLADGQVLFRRRVQLRTLAAMMQYSNKVVGSSSTTAIVSLDVQVFGASRMKATESESG